MYSNFGPRISRIRLRESLNRVRQILRLTPPMQPIRRRVYYVKGPLSMLHIDGYHGLTRLLKHYFLSEITYILVDV